MTIRTIMTTTTTITYTYLTTEPCSERTVLQSSI